MSSETWAKRRDREDRLLLERLIDGSMDPMLFVQGFSNVAPETSGRAVEYHGPPTAARKVVRASLGIDWGTFNSSASFRLQFDDEEPRPQPGRDSLLASCIPVTFPHGNRQMRTQVGYRRETDELLCGDDLEDAIVAGTVRSSDRMEWLKLAAIDDSEQTQGDRSRLQAQIDRLPSHIRDAREDPKGSGRCRKLAVRDLISDFLGYLIRYSLLYMLETCTYLPWAGLRYPEQYQTLNPSDDMEFQITIAVPALASPEFVQMIVSAVRSAGFSNAETVSEPVCALQHLLQKDFEGNRAANYDSGVSIIADIGAGTADFETVGSVGTKPHRFEEQVPGEGLSGRLALVSIP